MLKQNFAHQVLLASVFYCGTQNRVMLVTTDISLAACSLVDSVWPGLLALVSDPNVAWSVLADCWGVIKPQQVLL